VKAGLLANAHLAGSWLAVSCGHYEGTRQGRGLLSQLADLIEARVEEITQRWADQLFATGVPEAVRRADVIDSLPAYLRELVEALRREQGFQSKLHRVEVSSIAKGHGRQRFSLGYDVGAMVREYGALRDVLFQIMEETGFAASVRELRVLSKYLIGAIADAASQYALERDEEVRRQAAQHMSFLAHELRNPLASARLTVDVMHRRGQLPKSHSADLLSRSLHRLSDLIDNALVEMRLRAVPEPKMEDMPVDELLHMVAADSAAELETKNLRLNVEAPAGLRMQADRRLLYSALSNLVRNAVKFSREGGAIHLRAKRDGGRLTVEVQDSCGGLPESRMQSLFNPFVQMGQDRSGFGLGLAIAKQAVEAHEGELRVHDLPGQGCIFVLDMPAHPVPPKQ
jgi:hypothetical protein